jgi:hypothetical protein
MNYSFRPSVKWVGAACAGMLLAALTTDTAWSQRMSKQEAVRAAQALANWLDCEKCEHGELEAVTRYGQAIVPSLIAALNQGPSPATREILRGELEARYEQLVEQRKKNPNAPITASKEQFVELYLGNFDVQHRVRAAQALAVIGGNRARAALEAAANQAQRDDVRATMRDSLSKFAR